jgi:hypothetical protein
MSKSYTLGIEARKKHHHAVDQFPGHFIDNKKKNGLQPHTKNFVTSPYNSSFKVVFTITRLRSYLYSSYGCYR